MTESSPRSDVRRVVAAYDALTSDETSLTALTEMAARLQAELELLFVEDSDLLRVAGLPLARQINLRTGGAAPMALGELEAEMRAAGMRLRRRLADAAGQRHIRWSFRTVRGEAVDEVLLASEAADLLVLRHRRSWVRHRPERPQPAQLARQARPSVLLLEHGSEAPRSTAVLFRPGEQGRRALALAARLASAGRGSLDVLVSDPGHVETAAETARSMVKPGSTSGPVRYGIIRLAEQDVLSDAAERARQRLLVIGADDPILKSAEALDDLIAAARSILLVR